MYNNLPDLKMKIDVIKTHKELFPPEKIIRIDNFLAKLEFLINDVNIMNVMSLEIQQMFDYIIEDEERRKNINDAGGGDMVLPLP